MTNNHLAHVKVNSIMKLTELKPVYKIWKGKNLFLCKGKIFVGYHFYKTKGLDIKKLY